MKILVTTDLSDESVTAFATAAKLARKLEAAVTVLAVIGDPARDAMLFALDFPVLPDREVQEQFKAKVTEELKDYQGQYFSGLKSEALIREAAGPIHSEILRCAKEGSYDLIVMARQGHSTIAKLLMGSTTERVANEATCPVLIVPVTQ